MVFPILGGNTESALYQIENSCRFNNDNSTLIKSFGAAGNRRTFTVSTWVKLGDLASGKITGTQTGGDNYFFIGNRSNGQFTIQQGDDAILVSTKALNRDPSAWYHTVFAFDTTQGTDTNRVKIYVNGVSQDLCYPDAFTTAPDYPAQNLELFHNMTTAFGVGCRGDGDNPLEGYLSEFYFIDGTQYAASDFGKFNNNGIWIPKEAKDDLTFGTNGFYMEFKQTGTGQDSSGIGADTSGNDNHFAVANLAATDQTTDTPTNNFCTMNPLDAPPSTNHTFSEGNCKVAWSAAAGNFGVVRGTMGVSSGKWYWEVKYTYGNAVQLGVFDVTNLATTLTADVFSNAQSSDFNGLAWRIDTANNIKEVGEGQATDSGVDFSTGDILGIAFDADNGKLYAFDNGTELTGQDIGAGTSLLTAVTVSDFYLPFVSNGDGGSGTKTGTSELNFGNPTFSISSGNSDANGYGNFEYAVPSGYYALCTKNLAEFGG